MLLLNNRYKLGTLLGSGGMGDVYRGTVLQTGATVAIKVLKPEIAAGAVHHIDRFRQEGELLRDLNHPNIVKMLEAFEHDGQHFIVMEYVAGGSLRDLLNDTPQLPIERALWIALDLADALTRAHRLDVIHRDLKPENVLLAADGTPRLTDFGTARLANISMNTQEGSFVGTPYYFSPELLQQQPLDARADIWAFGVLLFEMLAGQRPFDGDSLSPLLVAILRKPVPDLERLRPDAPTALIDLVYRMLQKDRDARIPSVRLVGAELEALLRGANTAQPLVSPAAPVPDKLILISTGPSHAALENGAGSRFITPSNAAGPRHNLPAQTTPFVGREDELADLARLIAAPQTRLITVLGPGGMGKTRLTLEAAARYLGVTLTPEHDPNFKDGVFFVALASLTEPGAIIPALAEAVGLQFSEGQDPNQQVHDFLREKSVLLVMDNFEHLLDGANIVGEVLKHAPGVTVLASSRERLNLTGETIFMLGGMNFPDWETPADTLHYAAVQLFMSSARHTNPAFDLAPDDLPAAARICRLVAGMPLGIVLAAGWTDMLSVQEIANEITRSLDFLETETRDVPERQRSIRAVFESSWVRLSESEREVFMHLAIFRGGFTREAAQGITGVSLRGLQTLTNKALVRRDPASGRYEVHELLRQYAEQQLEASGCTAAAHSAHSAYYTEFARQQGECIKGPQQFDAFKALAEDRQNLQAALYWAAQQIDTEAIGKSLFAISMLYWEWSDNVIGEAWITPLATTLAGQPDILNGTDRARTAVYLQLRLMQHRLTPNQTLKHASAEEALRLLCDLDLWDKAHFFVMPLLSYSCMYNLMSSEEAVRRGHDVLAEHRKTNAWFEFAANAGMFAAILAGQMDHHEEAITLLDECLAISEQLGDRWIILFNLAVLGTLHHDRGRLEEARQLYERAYRRALDTNIAAHLELPMLMLSAVSYMSGRFDEATAYSTKRLEQMVKQGVPLKIARAQLDLADNLIATGAFDRANSLLASAEVVMRQFNDSVLNPVLLTQAQSARIQGNLATARQRLDAARVVYEMFPSNFRKYEILMEAGEIAFAEGDFTVARQHFEDVLAFITGERKREVIVWDGLFCMVQLGRIALRQNDLGGARRHLHNALTQSWQAKTWPVTMRDLVGMAEVYAAEGQLMRAAELAAWVQEQSTATYYTRRESKALLDQLEEELSPGDYTAAITRAALFDLEAAVNKLVDEWNSEP